MYHDNPLDPNHFPSLFIRQQEEQNMFEMHHAKLKAEKLDDLQERLANKRRGII